MVQGYTVGDLVRLDLPDETDLDHEQLHVHQGKVIDVLEDDASSVTGDERDDFLYRVELEGGTEVDVRWRDLRPR